METYVLPTCGLQLSEIILTWIFLLLEVDLRILPVISTIMIISLELCLQVFVLNISYIFVFYFNQSF